MRSFSINTRVATLAILYWHAATEALDTCKVNYLSAISSCNRYADAALLLAVKCEPCVSCRIHEEK